jgi:hypothetical protein
VPFVVPDSLLQQLRERREKGRRERAARNTTATEPVTNFVNSVQRLFDGAHSVDQVSHGYVAAMRAWQDEVETEHDAFLLDPGMGPMVYLTADGRILEDYRGWDGEGISEVTGARANAALVAGAHKTKITALLDLIAKAPEGGAVCPKCRGARLAEPAPGYGIELPCDRCECRGWV